jgi:predicted patatin/cPLA2 family phospholipase
VVLGNFTNRAELREALRASARIPFASGAPVRVRDEELIDGSVSQSIPVEAARELGATHVLALLTRPKGELRGRQRTLQKFGTLALLNRYLPGLGEVHATRPARYADEIKLLEELEAQDLAHAIQLSAAETSVRQLEQDPRVLFAGAAAGARAVHRHLTGVEPRFYGGLDIVADH